MPIELLEGAFQLGLLYSLPAIAITVLFRIVGFPDLTPDGTFTLGAAVSLISLSYCSIYISFILAFFIGAFFGTLTALTHIYLNVSKLLSGILIGLGLYTVNLRTLGTSNAVFPIDKGLFGNILLEQNQFLGSLAIGVFIFFIFIVIFWGFSTKTGLLLRALGDNELAFDSRGIPKKWLTILGVSFGNGIASLGGAVIADYQGFIDISMGVGLVISSLTAVIIGETILRPNSLLLLLLSPILGSIVFQFILSLSLIVGLAPTDLKALISVLTLIFIAVDQIRIRKQGKITNQIGNKNV